ncbi:MAG: M23 family metallopeptidase [Anaerolineae bacterium]
MLTRLSIILKMLVLVLLIALTAGIVARPGWAQTTGYRLPWRYCFWERVLQGWGESPSHNNTQMWYAYDFGLSEGVSVRAAKGGTVAFVQKGKTLCGGPEYANLANYVTIYHGDGTATLYLHLRDVYVSVGQSVLRGQTIGTAGRTGWTNCLPHLHFQRQERGAWITNSRAVYFDEYPGQQLQRNGWYQSQNYWPGDRCPTRAGAGWGCSGMVSIAMGRMVSRRGKGFRMLAGVVAMGLAVLVSGCGGPRSVPLEGALPGTPAVSLGPDQPVARATATEAPATEAPPPPPTPGPIPTPRPVVLPSAKDVQRLTEGWRIFEDSGLGVRFRYPADYQVRLQEDPGWRTISIIRPLEDGSWETFVSLFFWEYRGLPITTAEDLLKWESSLSPEMDPAGGKVFVVGELSLPQAQRGWAIRWEPLPGNSEVVVDSIVLLREGQIIWVNLSKPLGGDPQLEDALWAQQMAFLTTLEVFP